MPGRHRPPPAAADPQPQPPIRPDNDDCCNSGCSPCVFDMYEEEMERYRVELATWEARNGHKSKA